MTRETYRGVKLVVKKGRQWGYLACTVNGVPFGEWIGQDEAKMIAGLRGYVDDAYNRPDAYEAHWRAA